MLTVFEAINFSPRRTNASKRKSLTETLLGLRSIDPSFFNASKIPSLQTSLGKTIGIIGVIKKAIVIVALAAQDFQAPPQPLGSIRPFFLFGTIETATGNQSGKTETWVKSFIIIVTKKSILLINESSFTSQKLVLILAISILVTDAKKTQKVRVLDRVLCICYQMQFRKDKDKDVLAFFNSKSKINMMTPAYVAQIDFKVQKTNVVA